VGGTLIEEESGVDDRPPPARPATFAKEVADCYILLLHFVWDLELGS
jgi:hypothetical protein